ncbi:MAG: hypothetical protein RL338_1637 [Chloroflexota bacterium]|jgi:EmrB/QacA subfamily drug resistance transporter
MSTTDERAPEEVAGATPSLEEDPALGLSRRQKFEILAAIMVGLFLGALDQTIVGTALPRIVTDLGGNDLYVWVVTSYLLTSTISVPFYGKLSDVYGRKPLLMGGIGLFLVGSVLAGLSSDMTQLILFRGIQGLGAGSLFPISLAVIGDLFSPAERGKYQGLFGAVFGISFLVGPALGGFLTDAVSWHWIFFVNLPVGAVALYVIWHLLPNIRRKDASRHFDVLGGVVFIVGIAMLLIGLTNKQSAEWTSPEVGGLIAASLAILAVFVLIERRAAEPIVPLDLFRNRTYASSIVSTFFVSTGFFGAVIFLPRWFQVVQGSSATESGYQQFPLLLGLIGGSIASGQIVARTGRYKALIAGSLALTAVGLVLMTQLRATTELPVLWAWMFATGLGLGPTLAVYTIIVQNAVPFSRLGVATSNLTFFRQVGGSVGLAVAGTVFATALETEMPAQLGPVLGEVAASVPPEAQAQFGQLAGGLADGLAAGGLDLNALAGVGVSFGEAFVGYVTGQAPADLQPVVGAIFGPFVARLDLAFHEAFSLAIGQVFVLGVGAAAVALVAALAMKELPLRVSRGGGGEGFGG